MNAAPELTLIGLCGQSVFLTVPHFHAPGETLHASSLFREPGGKGYNQAVAAARLGSRVAFAGAVGQDADGEACASRLRWEGVSLIHMFCKEHAPTAYAVILTDAAGENRVTVYPGASACLTAEDVRTISPWLEEARMALLTPEIPEEAFAEAFRIAKKAGVPVVVNPAPFQPWVMPYLKKAWCVIPNRSEAQAMLKTDEADGIKLAQGLAGAGIARAVVTLGEDGAALAERGKALHTPSRPVLAVDTTGAGDAFCAALCVRLLRGDSLAEAARFAVWAASYSVMSAHVLDGLMTAACVAPPSANPLKE